jgi:hypothetical protein
MEHLANQYIDQCLRIGLLTKEKIRKYPLRAANLVIVVKVYALHAKLPFTIDTKNIHLFENEKLYLTEVGLQWLMNEFKKYTLPYLRSTFQYIFPNLKDIKDIDTYDGTNNFKGITGINYKAGTTNKAVLVRSKGASVKQFEFINLVEARKELLSLTRFYPLEEFTLYRTGTDSKGVYYRHKVPLILESNRRGTAINLPHLKGKV